MRRPRWFAVLLGACALVACGGGSSASSTPAFLTASPPPTTADATPSGTPSPAGAVACLPVDTPVDQAPAAIAKVWRDRDVNIVPSCSVFDVRLPAFVNLAKSAGLSDADAMKIAEARIRREQMGNWGEEHRQLHIADSLTATSLYSADVVNAVNDGFAVYNEPDTAGCATPNEIVVLEMPPGTASGLSPVDPQAKPGPWGVIVHYGPGDCSVVGKKNGLSKVIVPSTTAQAAFLSAGIVKHDSALGTDTWYETANGTCGVTPIASASCRLAGF